MNWDQVDALTMVPGIIGVHWLAARSDDFLFRIAALSWTWCCMCSMIYHLHNCDPKLLRYDLRSQWVSITVMSLVTHRHTQLIALLGIIPFRTEVRQVLNCLSAFYFASHSWMGLMWMAMAFGFYALQFPTKIRWMHSAFHICLHLSGLQVALDPRPRWAVAINPGWAYVIQFLGALILIPNSVVYECVDSFQTWASNLFYIRNSWTDLPARYLASRGPIPSCALSGTCDCTHEEQPDLVGSSAWTRGARSRRTPRRLGHPNTPEPSGPDIPETSGPQPDPVQTPLPDRNDT
jgi:hypothetical protein